MSDRGVRLTVFAELDVGGMRAGCSGPEQLLKLVREIEDSSALVLGGIQAYQGAAQHQRGAGERSEAVRVARRRLLEARSLLESNGIAVNTITGGGTGTLEFDLASGIYNEVQPGSYIFNDADYARNLDEAGKPVGMWTQSLFVLATVLGKYERFGAPGVMIDVGLKSLSFDSGPPLVHGHPEAEVINLGDEHTFIKHLDAEVGERVKLVPGHCDPTVNMHSHFLAVRGQYVEAIWPVDGRGPGL